VTHFLITDKNPEGSKLEDVLRKIRADILYRCGKIVDDENPIAGEVLANNIKILEHMTQSIDLAESSTKKLDKAFGPSGRTPRIGEK
jgi:hypothetical protein